MHKEEIVVKKVLIQHPIIYTKEGEFDNKISIKMTFHLKHSIKNILL